MKRVKLPSSQLIVTFKIGGNQNPAGIQVTLFVEANYAESALIKKITNEIGDTLILPQHFNNKESFKKQIKYVAILIKTLMDLNCVNQKNMLQSATHAFCQYTLIYQMPWNPIKLGGIGYEIHEKERHAVGELIQRLNRTFTQEDVFDKNFTKTLQAKTENYSPKIEGYAPTHLEDFVQSIKNNRACIESWKRCANQTSPDLLSQYFDSIARILQSPASDKDKVNQILTKISFFIAALSTPPLNNNLKVLISMLKTLINQGGESPQRVQNQKALQTLNNLFSIAFTSTDSDFTDKFADFRDALSQTLENISDIEDKRAFLTMLNEPIQNYSAPTHHTKILQAYMARTVVRASQHINNDDLLSQLNSLQEKYASASIGTRQHYKLTFLELLVENIKSWPEKDYATCYEKTKEGIGEPTLKAILNEWSGFRMFGANQFKNFLRDLQKEEINFNQQYPRSLTTQSAVPGSVP